MGPEAWEISAVVDRVKESAALGAPVLASEESAGRAKALAEWDGQESASGVSGDLEWASAEWDDRE